VHPGPALDPTHPRAAGKSLPLAMLKHVNLFVILRSRVRAGLSLTRCAGLLMRLTTRKERAIRRREEASPLVAAAQFYHQDDRVRA